jgi:adenylate cyclase class 2
VPGGDLIVTNDRREVEIKLRVNGDIAEIRRRLERAGFNVSKPRVFESNTLFDTAERTLRATSQLLRLRRVEDACTLTYKGSPAPGKHKSREEIETGVSNEANMELVFCRLGFSPVFRYEKFRTEHEAAGQAGVVTLDETPIGNYLEIEGVAEWIDRVAEKLGFSEQQYITQSYAGLYFDYCREHGIDPTNMVFEPGS